MGKYDIPQFPVKRLRYFNNQFLNEKDFIDDQAAHLAHERAQLRAMCTPGVLEGLVVTPGAAGAPLQISSGIATDKNGRLIVLDPAATGPAPSGLANGSYLLYIQYSEVASDVAPNSDATRWTSQPVINAVANQAGLPGDAVVLGSFTVSAAQITAQSTAGRQYAGVRLPGPGSQVDPPVAATLTTNGSTNDGAILAGTLAVRRDVGAGLGPTLTLTNGATAAANSAAALDFNVYDPAASDPAARIQAIGDGNSSAALVVSTKAPGAASNVLAERFRITAGGDAQFKGGIAVATGQHVTLNGTADLTVGGGITASGGITVPTGQHVTLNGTADLTVGGGITASGGITVATGQHVTLNGTADLTVGGGITASGGITVPTGQHVTLNGTADLTVGGALNANGGITVPTGQHVTLNGTADLTVGGALNANGGITVPTGQHVTLNGTADLTMSGILNANGGIAVATGKHVTLSGTTDLTVGGTLKVVGTAGTPVTITRFTAEAISGMSDADRQATVPTGSAVKTYVDSVAAASSGRLLAVKSLTGSGAVPSVTAGTTRVRVRMIGGGGGGGGAATIASTGVVAAGAGGSSGVVLEVWVVPSGAIAYGNYSCGAGGSGGSTAGGDGGNGGDTTITINGADYTTRGGAGGTGMSSTSPTAVTTATAKVPAASPTIPGAGQVLRSGVYGLGGHGNIFSGVKIAGVGGASEFGAGGLKASNGAGPGGGGGGGEAAAGGSQSGGSGAAGCIVIEEYS